MELIFALQLMLPIALIVWPLLSPPPGRLAWMLHVLALAAVIAALLLAGIWTVLPWWLPWLFAVAGALVLALRWPRAARRSSWVRHLLLLPPLGLGLWLTASAITGHRPPDGALVPLASPLPRGDYLVLSGGTSLAVNSHAETLDLSVPRHRLFHGQSHGLDIVALNAAGRTTGGIWPRRPGSYAIYGTPILAPCAGTVLASDDGVPDQPVPDAGTHPTPGNSVLLRCGGVDVLLAHFAPGSLAVRTGQRVRVSQRLGRAGNSGSSNEPHLHIHAQRPGTEAAPLSGTPLPILIEGRWLLRGSRFRPR